MKNKVPKMMLLILLAILVRCSDDDKPQTIPVVVTAPVTEININSAMASGEISDNGNTTITATGFVYSSVVAIPTLADDKVTLTVNEDEFSALLEDLVSGTSYRVRAYATNSKGTGYGEVVTFTTGNAAPVVTSIEITGSIEVGKEITATYTYSDAENDAETGSTFQWYMANDATGTDEVAITGATSLTYEIAEVQEGKYLRISIIPKAITGTETGIEAKSAFVGAVGEATTVTFSYNGSEVTYGIINSSITGRKWLDRNLGAPNIPTSHDNYQNYGDLFQWGRPADGHQLIIRGGANDSDMVAVNGTTTTQFSSDTPGSSLFFIDPVGVSSGDWRSPSNNNLWQGVNGINNPCPSGWRIATQTEWAAEGITNIEDGYSKLKLTYTSVRTFDLSEFYQSTTAGNYWTSTLDSDPRRAIRVWLSPAYTAARQARAQGFACRCIKD